MRAASISRSRLANEFQRAQNVPANTERLAPPTPLRHDVGHEERISMIFGTHAILYSKDADADRAFFRDVLGLAHVDAGHGWLIFALPPAEIAVHPGDEYRHELYLMCDDLLAEIAILQEKGVSCSAVHKERWGSITKIKLPSGGELGLYQPKHPTALELTSI
jgi:catechol 2,3-dioxygenase-like lactoylglutathione lyase family enzyme